MKVRHSVQGVSGALNIVECKSRFSVLYVSFLYFSSFFQILLDIFNNLLCFQVAVTD